MASFWNNKARKYAAMPVANEAAYQQTLASVRAHLTSTSRVVEVGCGTGSTVLKLAPFAGSILGTDFSPAMIEICREKLKAAWQQKDDGKDKTAAAGLTNVSFAVGDICRPDGHAASTMGAYDVALAFNLLYLLEDQRGAIRNINSLVKPGGLFITKNMVTDGNVAWKFRVLSKLVPLMYLVGLAPPAVNFRSTREMEGDLTDGGFEIVESVFPKGDEERRYIVARKVKEA